MKGLWVGCLLAAGLMMSSGPGLTQTPATSPPPPAAAVKASATASTPAPAPKPGPTAPSKPPPAGPAAPPPPPPGPPPGTPASPGPNEPEQGAPGVPSDSSTVTLDVPSRPVALLAATAKWDEAFKVIKDTEQRVKAAVDKAGLPVAMFTKEDDNGFTFTAMLPLAPGAKATLTDGVTLGQSPAGKAIKFQHRGAYDDIDSTYDLVTAYLDEKGLEAQDFFIEEYLTPLTSGEDPYLAVDIYVFLKP